MFDFEFHNPTRILFGRGRADEIGRELAAAGVGRVLLVSGQGSAERSGLLDRVRASLTAAGVEAVAHPGVVANPELPHVLAGVALAREAGADAVLAVGGGSVIDEAKTIACGVFHDGDLWDLFRGQAGVERALPVHTVLTLAATGSEMNGNAVVTNPELRQKYSITSPHLYPRLSILDPELTFTVPPYHTACGAVDAIAHLLEAYFTKQPGTRLQDRLVESIMLTVMENTEVALREPENYEARAALMWAATLALNGLTPAGVGPYGFPNHMIEHAISAIHGIAHGAGLAIVLPAWMRWRLGNGGNLEQHERFARVIFGLDRAQDGIDALEEWFVGAGVPTRLADAGIPEDSIPAMAENAATLAEIWGMGADYPAAVVEEILRLGAPGWRKAEKR